MLEIMFPLTIFTSNFNSKVADIFIVLTEVVCNLLVEHNMLRIIWLSCTECPGIFNSKLLV